MDTRPGGAAPEARHETRDADIRSLVIFAGVLIGIVLLTMIGMARVFHSSASDCLLEDTSTFSLN